MTDMPDYYRILHVQEDAPAEIIQASYRTLMQRLRNHPDLGGDHAHAVLLNEAHAVLTDPERRAAYDLRRSAEPAAASQHESKPETCDSTGETSRVSPALRCVFCGTAHRLERAVAADDQCGECASPLFPAERHRLEYSGQRMLSRIPKRRAVSLYAAWPQPEPFAAEMLNVSLNGMLLQTPVKLPLDKVIKVDSALCRALARVAHCRRDPDASGRWLVGVEFLTLRLSSKRGSFVSSHA